MSDTFADAARRASHAAAQLLGWRPPEFWAATPAELVTALGLDTPIEAPAGTDVLGRMMKDFPDGQ